MTGKLHHKIRPTDWVVELNVFNYSTGEAGAGGFFLFQGQHDLQS